MRLCTLYHLWCATSSARAADSVAHPASVVARIVHDLRQQMREHYTRCTLPPSAYAAVCGGWLPKRPQPEVQDFVARWAQGGVLCEVQGGLLLRLTSSHPVPLSSFMGPFSQ